MLSSLPLVPILASLLLASCMARNSPNSTMSEARLQASEAKVLRLEKRLESLELKTKDLDAISVGVQTLLAKLAALDESGGGAKAPRPSSTAIYSLDIQGDPYIGPKYAKVTMVKGYDFYCGYCDKVRPVLAQLQKEYGKDLKIVFKNFVIHDDYARLPALAACAANLQGKFMPMFEQIWVDGMRARHELTEADLLAMAKKQKLNQKRFVRDMHGSCETKIQSDLESMAAVGATGTPAFYINGRFISGALPIARYKRVIDQELAKANQAISTGMKLKDYYQKKVVLEGRTSL